MSVDVELKILLTPENHKTLFPSVPLKGIKLELTVEELTNLIKNSQGVTTEK